MNIKNIAIVIFYDDDENVVFQIRGSHSKVGEKYGFFGGGIKEGEDSKQALRRELREEIDFVPDNLEYWMDYFFVWNGEDKYKGWKINLSVFLSPITAGLEKVHVLEGAGIVKWNIDRAIERGELGWVEVELLKKLKAEILN